MKSAITIKTATILLFLVFGGLDACKRHNHAASRRKKEFSHQVGVILPSDVPEIGLAAFKDDRGTLRRLLSSGVSVESVGKDKRTPLMLAAAGSNYEAALILLQAGANVDAQDLGSLTALHWAATRKNEKLVQLLLSHNAQVNIQDSGGGTALISAAEVGSKEIVQALIAAGANPDVKDADGYTALTLARINKNQDIVSFLEQNRK